MPAEPEPRREPDDPLLPAAYQLARFYALLSPGLLQRELEVDRARAERLIAALVAAGALGPVFVERSGARESLVNMVNEGPPAGELPAALPAARGAAGRAAIAASAGGLALGLGLGAWLVVSGLGLRVVDLLGLALASPALARVAGLLLIPPAAGAGLAWLVERLFGPDEALVPYWALRLRQGLWTLYGVAALGLGAAWLFR